MENRFDDHSHEAMTELLDKSLRNLGSLGNFLSSGKEMGLEWPAACGNIYKSIQLVPNGLKANGYFTATMERNTSIWMCLLVKQMLTTETSIWVVRTRSNKLCIY